MPGIKPATSHTNEAVPSCKEGSHYYHFKNHSYDPCRWLNLQPPTPKADPLPIPRQSRATRRAAITTILKIFGMTHSGDKARNLPHLKLTLYQYRGSPDLQGGKSLLLILKSLVWPDMATRSAALEAYF